MTTWLVRLNFLPGERASGAQVAADNVGRLRRLPGVEHVDFHVDLNDDCALWAIWRLNTYDAMLSIYDEPAFKTFASTLKPKLVQHSVDNFILSPLAETAQ